MKKSLIRFALTATTCIVTYYLSMLVIGSLFDYAAQNGYVRSDHDIGRGVLWAIFLSVILALLAAFMSLRLTRRLLN